MSDPTRSAGPTAHRGGGRATDKWPLVGRHGEVEQIRQALTDRSVRRLVLAGPAGVGKTRLAMEALHIGMERGFVPVRVLATRSAAGVPLGALAPLLPAYVDRDVGSADALRQARSGIVGLGNGHPVALLVDDAHLLDDLSATVVWQLADVERALVVVTVRSDAIAPDPVMALWKEERGERLDVRALDASAVADLLSTVLKGAVESRTLRTFVASSGGNPLYLRELVTAALEQDVLRSDGNVWRLADELVLSHRLVELVDSRIGALDQAEQRALELVSFGEPLPVALLEQREASAVATLERRALVQIARDGRRLVARLAHPLYGEAVRARTPNLAARAVHKELADLMERTVGRRREDPLRFAQWRLEGGGTAPPELMLQAAQVARNRFDLALAGRLAEAAGGTGGSFDAALLAAQLRMLDGRPEEAETLFADLVTRAETDVQRTAATSSRITNLLRGLARPEAACRVADEAAAAISDPEATVELAAVRAELLCHLGRSGQALAVADPIVDRVRGRALVKLAPAAALALIDAGRLERAVAVAKRGYEAHVAQAGPTTPFGPQIHLVRRGMALTYAGRFSDAQELAERGYAEAVEEGSVEAHADFAHLLGWILILRGSATAGAHYISESLALYRDRGWKTSVMSALANLAQAQALRGDVEAAATALAELDALEVGGNQGFRNRFLVEAWAWLDAAEGDLTRARHRLLDGAESARRSASLVLEATLLHDYARLGGAGDVAPRLAELAYLIDGDLVKARAEYAAALHLGDHVRLEAVAKTFDDLGAWLFAAEAAAGAAVALRRAGARRRAVVLERSSAAFVRKCEGAVTPAVRGLESQALLSAREFEVASLAAAGLSNRAIADRLYVSVRTVETQLQHVYQKLGVSRRTDLLEALDAS